MGAMSPQNNIRQDAETVFEQAKAQPDVFISHLVTIVQSSGNMAARQFCAVMLRQQLSSANPMWIQLSPQTQATVKHILMELFSNEQQRSIRRKICDVIGMLACKTLNQDTGDTWPELIPLIVQVSQSPLLVHKESVLDIVEKLAEFVVHALKPHASALVTILSAGLQEENEDCSLAAVKATVSLFLSLERSERKELKSLVAPMFAAVQRGFAASSDRFLQEALPLLTDFAEEEPGLCMKDLCASVVGLMGGIARSMDLEDGVRNAALNFLVVLTEKGKALVRRHPELPACVIPLSFEFMLTLEHTQEWCAGVDDDDCDFQLFRMGGEAIARLSSSMGPLVFLPVATPIIQQCLAGQEWTQRNAGVLAIGYMADGCSKTLKKDLANLIQLVMPLVTRQGEHVRVRYSAVWCLAQISVDFAPKFQQQFAGDFVKAITLSMMPSPESSSTSSSVSAGPCYRVQIQAALALVDFCATAEGKHVIPHQEVIFTALLGLMQIQNIKVQEAALSALACTASKCGSGAEGDEEAANIAKANGSAFENYYARFMPDILGLIAHSQGPELRELRGKAFECVGWMGQAVGPAVFAKDASTVMEFMLRDLQSGLASDDPQYNYIVQACCRVAKCMGTLFVPYLDLVLPALLRSAARDDCCMITDDDADASADATKQGDDDGEDGYHSVTLAIRGVGNKKISLNTSYMEEKATSCNMLFEYALCMKEHYLPWVQQTAAVLVPLCRYRFNETVRCAAQSAMPALLGVCSAAVEVGVPGTDPNVVSQLWEFIFPQFFECLQLEPNLETVAGIMDLFSNSLSMLRGPPPLEHMRAINTLIKQLVSEQQHRQGVRDAEMESPDFAEEDAEEYEADQDLDDEILGQVHLMVLQLAKKGGSAYLNPFHTCLYPLVVAMLDEERPPSCKSIGTLLLSTALQYLGSSAPLSLPSSSPSSLPRCSSPNILAAPETNNQILNYASTHFPQFLVFCADPYPSLRQSASFAIGCCAQLLTQHVFASIAEQALSALLPILSDGEARAEENEPATDNAISSLFKILRYHNACLPAQGRMSASNLTEGLLAFLPLKGDEDEACEVHALLCTLVEEALSPQHANHVAAQFILGSSKQHVPRLLQLVRLIPDSAGEVCPPALQQRLSALTSSLASLR